MVISKYLVIVSILFLFLAQVDNSFETESLSKIFKEQVANINHDQVYIDWLTGDALRQISAASGSYQTQYFVYVDRNPEAQNIMLGLFDSVEKNITIIGWDKVSTGNPKIKGHFVTPTGIFVNSVTNMGYRAQGTKNSNGWRGLGKKGSRVWDFGWQKTQYKNEEREIRLLLHATDPDFGERRLGKVDSKGCVRITAKLNYFLDHYGILDNEYEQSIASGTVSWLLPKDRETVKNPGQLMIVGDSYWFFMEEDLLP